MSNVKTEKITFRCTSEEKKAFEQAASMDHMSTATHIRKLALIDVESKGIELV